MAIFEHIRLFNAGVWQAAQEDEPHGLIERSKQINSRVVLQSIMLASIYIFGRYQKHNKSQKGAKELPGRISILVATMDRPTE